MHVTYVYRARTAVDRGRPRSNVCERGGRSQKSSVCSPSTY